jgi:phytoene dehydrogenase-like protein
VADRMSTVDVNAVLGRVGLPEPLTALAARDWDAIVVGAGHNGLTAAAYLAREGRSVLVLERREQIGGACTLERPFADQRFVVSPCAYVVGLLDRIVIDELELGRHGYRVTPADPNLWCPLPGGGSFASFIERGRTTAYLREQGFADAQIEGLLAYEDAFERCRRALRLGAAGDTWLRPSPGREELERILADDELISIAFEESISQTLDRYLDDERLRHALFAQGLIGTFAGPRDPGTASIKLMHHQGDLLGLGSVWGYVEGGMGRASFAIAQAALEAGAEIAAGVPVARILAGEGVEVESGELIRAPVVVCNADPKRLLGMLDGSDALPADYRERLERWDTDSPVVKVNLALERMPTFPAAAGTGVEPHRAMVTVTPGIDAAQDAVEACRRGEFALGFAELYFQSAYDESVVPPGREMMSVFAQYAPYELADGDWDARRDQIAAAILDAIAVHAPDVHDCVVEAQVLGPPDIERRIGLSGGHIFQGQALPAQMWDRRLEAATPVEGVYLCGAATHPGGSVIGLNGRIAAVSVLERAGESAIASGAGRVA